MKWIANINTIFNIKYRWKPSLEVIWKLNLNSKKIEDQKFHCQRKQNVKDCLIFGIVLINNKKANCPPTHLPSPQMWSLFLKIFRKNFPENLLDFQLQQILMLHLLQRANMSLWLLILFMSLWVYRAYMTIDRLQYLGEFLEFLCLTFSFQKL